MLFFQNKKVTTYKFRGKPMFKPLVSALQGKSESLDYLYDHSNNSIVFIHMLRSFYAAVIKCLFVYQLESDGNYGLLRNTPASSIKLSFIFDTLYDMKMIFGHAVGKRGTERIIYKLFDIITLQVSEILIPHSHVCSVYRNHHTHPLLFNLSVTMVRCTDKNGTRIQTLFNIEWQNGQGVLRAGHSFYEEKAEMYRTDGGDLIQLVKSRSLVFSICLRFPQSGKPQTILIRGVPTEADVYRQISYYQQQSIFIICFYNRFKMLKGIGILSVQCIPLDPLIDARKCSNEIRIGRWGIRYGGGVSRETVLMHTNGELFSPIPIVENIGRGIQRRLFRYFKLFKPVE
jgi:hypothetical protein